MKEYGLTLLVAAAVTYLLTPLTRRFAIMIGAQHEGRERDVHTEPTPLLGGLAMYFGLAAGLLVASRMYPLSGIFQNTRVGSGLLLGGAVLVLMGVVDDRYGLGVLTKLAGQIAAGAILVWSGAVIYWLPLPGGATLVLTPDEGTILTILLVVVTINAVNFIDGLDGLATGIAGIGAAAFYLYYYTLAKRLGLSELADTALASAVLAGVCLGFLPHNFYRARIFMGDTGSMLLGLLLAYAPISSLASIDPQSLAGPAAYSGGTVNRFPEILPLLVPATIMLIPYLDLLLAVVRRTRAGQSPFAADKKHLQHRLLAIGHSHRTSVLIMYLWAALFAGTVVLLSIIRTKLPILGAVTLAGILVLLWMTMPRLRPWGRRSGSRPVPAAASPAPAGRPAGPGSANPGPVSPTLAHPAAARSVPGNPVPGNPVPGKPVPGNPVPGNPVPGNPVPGNPAAARRAPSHPVPPNSSPARPDPAQPAATRPAGDAGRPGPAGNGTPAGYRAPDPHGTPSRYDSQDGYATLGPPPAAGAGPGEVNGRGGRSDPDPHPAAATGRNGRDGRSAPDPDTAADGGLDGLSGGGRSDPDPDPAAAGGLGGLSGRNGRSEEGLPAGAPAQGGNGGNGAASPARPYWEGSRWDAPPPESEPRWDAPPPGPAGSAAADPQQQPGTGRPAWPGDYPEAHEPLLPWRFG